MKKLLILAFAVSSLVYAQEDDIFMGQFGVAPQLLKMDEAIGKTPKTVFIPGRFYQNGKGALFINGQRFATRTGAADVQGFISKGGTYVIAVHDNVTNFTEKVGDSSSSSAQAMFTDEELKKLPPEMRLKALQMMGGASKVDDRYDVNFGNGPKNSTIFYRCSTSVNCNIARVIKGLPSLQMTADAIWFSDPSAISRVGQNFTESVLSYSGIDIDGNRLDGPVGVLYAAPLPQGNWLLKKVTKEQSTLIGYSWTIKSPDGAEQTLFRYADDSRIYQSFEIPSSIIVDSTPISTSAQYGIVSTISGSLTSTAWQRPVCAFSATKDTVIEGTAFFSHDKRTVLSFLASQQAIVPINGKLTVIGQAKVKGNGEALLGAAELDCQESNSGSGSNLVVNSFARIRKDGFSLNQYEPTIMGLGGFIHVRYPKGNLILLTEKMKEGKSLPGIQVEDGKRIALADINRFIERYGLINQ
ncbi:MAG: hypothetical protein WC073_14805 [Sterolibacterium sp.]